MPLKFYHFSCRFVLFIIFSHSILATELNIGSFNINSARTSATTIAKQMAEFKSIDIWGISESCLDCPSKILTVLKDYKNFDVIKGTTTRDTNLLQIYYNKDKFYLVAHTEIDKINKFNRVRAPLVALLKNKETNELFYFMVNHLYRSNNKARLEQAIEINQWTQNQKLPVIAVGDYNFDLSPYNVSKRGPGFDALINDNIYHWIKPTELLPTQCSNYQSILDFVFISRKLNYKHAYSIIAYPDTDYCMNKKNSDHRPLLAFIEI